MRHYRFGERDAPTMPLIGGQIPDHFKRLRAAREKVRYHCPAVLPTFDAIVRNGNNREKSIWELLKP